MTGGDCGSIKSLLLDEGEFICASSGYSNDDTGVTTSLSVTTSQNQIWGPFGDTDMHNSKEPTLEKLGNLFSRRVSLDEGWLKLTHLSGDSRFGKKKLRFHWKAAKNSTEKY